MKKNTILQLILIYIGLNTIYVGLGFILQNLFFFFSAPASETSYVLMAIAGYCLVCMLCVFIIGKSGSMSTFVADRSGLDDTITVYSKPQQLLSILIVVMALSQILTRIPSFINSVMNFGDEELLAAPKHNNYSSLASNFVSILIPCLVIVFCRQLTAYFSKNILLDEEDMIVHQDTVNIETTGEEPV